jgi:hypothetical protein
MRKDAEPSVTGPRPASAGAGREGPADPLAERVRAAAGGLGRMVSRAEAVQRERADAAGRRGAPRWTDVFTTQFTEFSNRPR